jgi:hypothetical protein
MNAKAAHTRKSLILCLPAAAALAAIKSLLVICVLLTTEAAFGEEASAREAREPPQRPVPSENSRSSAGLEIESDTDMQLTAGVLPSKPGDPVPPPELIVESLPSGAEVFVNQAYAGMTPLTLRSLPPGGYRLIIKKEQHKNASAFIQLEPGKTFRLRARLLRSTGILKTEITPPDAEVYAGAQRLLSSETQLPVGTYDILIRRFGYGEHSSVARISEGRTTALQVVLESAAFRAEGFSVSRARLNPQNPGLLGKTEFSFTVSAPGAARLSLINAEGNEVFAHAFAPFTAWKQSFLWDGRSSSGEDLPDGLYRAVLVCESEKGETPPPSEAEVEINRSLLIRYRNTWHGLSGLMYAASAGVLPPQSFQINSQFMGLAAASEAQDQENLYLFQIGGAAGLPGGLEVIPTLNLRAQSGEGGWPLASGSLGLKYHLLRAGTSPDFQLAATARGMLAAEPSLEGFSQFPGFAAGLAAQLSLGGWNFLAAPEALLSPYLPGREVSTEDPAAHYALTLRLGLFYETGVFSVGVSHAFSAALFPETPGLAYPLSTGLEAHLLVPDSFLNLSGFASWEHVADGRSLNRFFLGGGIGIVY